MTSVANDLVRACRAVWLDAAGTSIHLVDPVPAVYANYAQACGIDATPASIKARLATAMRQHQRLRAADRQWLAYWTAVVRTCVGEAPKRLVARLMEHYAQPGAWCVAPGVLQWLDHIRACGTRVAIVSNFDVRLRGLLDELGLLRRVDIVVVSAEVGVEKPHREIFDCAAAQLGVPAKSALMIGDDPVCDIEGAQNVGAAVMRFGSDFESFERLLDN